MHAVLVSIKKIIRSEKKQKIENKKFGAFQRGENINMEKIYDLIVIGGGPAGLAAGIYGARAKMDTLIIEKSSFGGMASKTKEIVNYPGIAKTSGENLGTVMVEHAKNLGAQVIRDGIREVELSGDIKIIRSRKKEYKAKSIILATGTKPRVLGIPGEKELLGSGVAYCATCDAEFFKNQHVVVVGSGDQAIEEGMFIAKYASKVTVIVMHDEGILDCNKLSGEEAMKHPKLQFIWNSTLAEVSGEDKVTGVKIKSLKNGKLTDLPCQGVFFFVGMIPNTEILEEKIYLDKRGFIGCDDLLHTSVPGVFAAGDVRHKYLKQVITAAADGALAAVAAEKYLEELHHFNKKLQANNGKLTLGFWNSLHMTDLDRLTSVEKNLLQNEEMSDFLTIDTAKNRNLAKYFDIPECEDKIIALILENSAPTKQITF